MATLINSYSLAPIIGINTYTPNKTLTVNGEISAQGAIWGSTYYGDGINLTGLNASNITSGTLSADRLPAFKGDIITQVGSSSATVVKIQGLDISTNHPDNGQVLQWNGVAWVPGAIPAGGNGGGGVTYYLDFANQTGIYPISGLPILPNSPSLLGREYSIGNSYVQTAELVKGSYRLIAGFVTTPFEPAVTNIPAGLWDFNLWVAVVGNQGGADQTQIQIIVHKYNSSTSTYTSLASSDTVYIYDPLTIAQYIVNVTMPQTTILSSDRIYVELYAQKNVTQSRQLQVYFDSLHPSHVHTTLPSVAGSGLVKTVNGVMQTPASLLVDVDVANNAQINQSKINGLTTALDNKFDKSGGTISGNLTVAGLISASNTNNWDNTSTVYQTISSTYVTLTGTQTLKNKTVIDWMTLARGYNTAPTLLATIGTGTVYTYVYNSSPSNITYYRFISTDGSTDAFYTTWNGAAVSGLVASKSIIL